MTYGTFALNKSPRPAEALGGRGTRIELRHGCREQEKGAGRANARHLDHTKSPPSLQDEESNVSPIRVPQANSGRKLGRVSAHPCMRFNAERQPSPERAK